jgi:tripartite-type tricarboxylate transporter receptor subunit TctC
VTTATRSDTESNIPTIGEFLAGYQTSTWFGVGAPKGTPAETIGRLNREINACLVDPKINAPLTDLGASALVLRPATLASSLPQTPRSGAR